MLGACDDLLVTFGGDGDPLLFGKGGGLAEVLRAARAAGVLSICAQTDLAGGDVDGLLAAIGEGNVDVVSVMFYGFTAGTYAKVAGADLHATVIRNMGRLAEVTRGRGGVPLVISRLLKVQERLGRWRRFLILDRAVRLGGAGWADGSRGRGPVCGGGGHGAAAAEGVPAVVESDEYSRGWAAGGVRSGCAWKACAGAY